MTQKIKLPYLVAIFALLIASVILFFVLNKKDCFDAIPQSAIAIAEVKNWNSFAEKLNTTYTGAELKKTDALVKLQAQLNTFQELLKADKSLQTELVGKTIASLYLTAAADYDFLFTTDLPGVNDNTLLNHVQTATNVRSVTVRIFKGQKIVEVVLKDGRQLSFAKFKNILSFSFTSFLTENAVSALLSGDNIKNDKSFKEVKLKYSPADMILYFNFSKADVIFPVAVKPSQISLLSGVSTYANWSRYEINFSNEQIELKGLAHTKADSKNIFIPNPAFSKLIAHIPNNAAYLNMLSTKSNTADGQQETAGTNSTINRFFENWVGDAKAFVIAEPLKEEFNDQNLCFVAVKNKANAIAGLKNISLADGHVAEVVDTFQQMEIYMLSDGKIIQQYFGNSFVQFTRCFYAVGSEVAVFAENSDVLKLVLEKISRKETLDKDPDFIQSGKGNIADNSQLLYIHPQRSEMMFRGILNSSSSLLNFVSSFKSVVQFSKSENDKITSLVFLKAGGGKKTKSGLLWRTTLQAPSFFVPQIMTNARTREREIFVQDTNHLVYLLNASGKILFIKNVEEPVLGQVYQLDYYKNGNEQLIFNTAHRVFILDKNGNDIGSYPLRLSAQANAGLLLVSENQRYYVPCENGSIYGYEANGKPLPGFSPCSGTGNVAFALQYVKTTNNDFILSMNNAGRLLLFDTKGKLKWKIENLPVMNQNFSVIRYKQHFTLLNAADNRLSEIALDGNDEIHTLMDTANFFTAIGTSDSSYLYYYANLTQVRAYDQQGEFKGSLNLNDGVITDFKKIEILNTLYLQILDGSTRKITLYDLQLKPVCSFAQTRNQTTAISQLTTMNPFAAITTSDDGFVSCFRLD